MPGFGKRVDGPRGRRRNRREDVVLAASALSLESSGAVVISDVSATGAKLQGRNIPPCGTKILLSIGELELFATVVWVGLHECGVTFNEPLGSDLIDRAKAEGNWSKVMGVDAAP